MKYPLLSLLLASSLALVGQAADTTSFARSPVYVQLGLGLSPSPGFLTSDLSAAVGYRISPAFGIGLEYRQLGNCNESFCRGAGGLGIRVSAL